MPVPVPDFVIATLRATNGPGTGIAHRLREPTTIIGRAPHVSVAVDDAKMSREHAMITHTLPGSEFRVDDLGSSNGTLLNGSQVTSYALRNGDKLLVGETLFVFEVATLR